MIKCNSIKGGTVLIPKEKLIFRPSAYAVIINDGKILMLNIKSNGKLFFPGGGLEIGETIFEALKREVKEEVGLEVEIEKMIYFKEQFFYYDPADEAYQMFNFFYLCEPLHLNISSDTEVDDEECEKPRWIDIQELKNKQDNLEVVDEVLKLI